MKAPRAPVGRIVGAAILAGLASGCAMEALYDVGQSWQQEQCRRLKDADERRRCELGHARSYDDYQAERARAASAPR